MEGLVAAVIARAALEARIPVVPIAALEEAHRHRLQNLQRQDLAGPVA